MITIARKGFSIYINLSNSLVRHPMLELRGHTHGRRKGRLSVGIRFHLSGSESRGSRLWRSGKLVRKYSHQQFENGCKQFCLLQTGSYPQCPIWQGCAGHYLYLYSRSGHGEHDCPQRQRYILRI